MSVTPGAIVTKILYSMDERWRPPTAWRSWSAADPDADHARLSVDGVESRHELPAGAHPCGLHIPGLVLAASAVVFQDLQAFGLGPRSSPLFSGEWRPSVCPQRCGRQTGSAVAGTVGCPPALPPLDADSPYREQYMTT